LLFTTLLVVTALVSKEALGTLFPDAFGGGDPEEEDPDALIMLLFSVANLVLDFINVFFFACSVYVGNLAFETSWQDLKDHMRAAGNVDKADVLQADDGRSKGCAVVTFQKPAEAQRAIRELQNTILHDRPIFVREDREQPRRRRN